MFTVCMLDISTQVCTILSTMQVTSISNFRKDIKKYVDAVDQDHEPLIVMRADNMAVVVISLEDYNHLNQKIGGSKINEPIKVKNREEQ